MTDHEEKRCIYCKKARLPSKEHVLQKSLGGDLTTTSQDTAQPVVCEKCNKEFSYIDQSLAERSLPAIARAVFTDPKRIPVQLGGEHFYYDSNYSMWLEVKIVNNMRAHLLPQIHCRDGSFSFLGSDIKEKDDFVDFVSKSRDKGSFVGTFVKIGPANKCTNPRLVQYRKNNVFVRAISEEEGRKFIDLIDAEWPELETRLRAGVFELDTIDCPNINMNIAVRLDDNYRAIAKIAFNFLAIRRGSLFACRDEFDGIRDYICGLNMVRQKILGHNEIAVDTRYVRSALFGDTSIVPTDTHAVALFYDKPTLWGLVTLYKKWSFVVNLGEIELNEAILEAHEFSFDRTGNKKIESRELFHRLWKHR